MAHSDRYRQFGSSSIACTVLCILLCLDFITVSAIPSRVTIPRKEQACMFDFLQKDEKVTISAFILSGDPMRGSMTLEGPLSEDLDVSTRDLWQASQNFGKQRNPPLSHAILLDWSDIAELEGEEEEDDEDEEEVELLIDAEDPDYEEKRKQQKERIREKQRQREIKLQALKAQQQERILEEGDPILHTAQAPVTGWYRMCVAPDNSQIDVEMEMRKESELGGIDEYGNVVTWEERDMTLEDAEFDKHKASEDGIKDEDFEDARNKMKDMKLLMNTIQGLQQKDRRLISVQTEINEKSHSRMAMNSLVETLFFMGITGFQVYTIRKWFSGAPVLGR